MFNFGLLPCPLCGGEPEVAKLTQLTAVIKCAGCGLTLEWETKIKVGVSRTGKRTVVEIGMNPIEAWNRRSVCSNCGYKSHSDQIGELPDCNTCGVFDCEHRPAIGAMTRINCPLWRARAIEEV